MGASNREELDEETLERCRDVRHEIVRCIRCGSEFCSTCEFDLVVMSGEPMTTQVLLCDWCDHVAHKDD